MQLSNQALGAIMMALQESLLNELDIVPICDKCETENSLTRLLNKPFINKKVKNNDTENTGELTKKYIEDNRDILEQQKKEIKNRTYDKS